MFDEMIVLEIADAWSGPTGGLLLSDFGAQVIKLEPPVWKRPLEVRAARRDDPVFLAANRGKKSVGLDVTLPQGKQVFEDLVRKADVLLTNSPPSVVRKLGFGYETLSRVNPRIICCNISGYGLAGEDVERPAYDMVIQAVSGVMSVTGGEGKVPIPTGILVADERGGIMAALGILAAYIGRLKTGKGRQVDVSMVNNLLFSYSREVVDFDLRGRAGRVLPYEQTRKRAEYRAYETADGHIAVTAGRGQDKWQALCEVLGVPEAGFDPRFGSYEKRITPEVRLEAERIVEPLFRAKTTAEWLPLLAAVDIPCARVSTMHDAVMDAAKTGMIVNVQAPTGGVFQTMGSPLNPGVKETLPAPPRFGQHSKEILGGLLGYAEEQISALAEEKAVVLES
ncbi:MAG: CoA transferase [Deltaproteobacteria bacterium]|nr:CoA transferase [Deltaproteobacteria bacterium]